MKRFTVLCPVGEPVASGIFSTENEARVHMATMPSDGCNNRNKHVVIPIYVDVETAVYSEGDGIE